jgi:flagellin-like hook-associated protein FlgL
MTQSIQQIRDAQIILGDLSNQLATGKKSVDLAGYTLTENRRLLDFSAQLTQRQSFLDSTKTAEPRLKVYDSALTSLDTLGNQALNLVNTTQNGDIASATALSDQLKGFLSNVQYYLNQKVGDRFIFAGSRYATTPVTDLTAMAAPTNTTIVNNPVLPEYDSEAPNANLPTAYDAATVKIDTNYTVTYGLSSDDPAFQKLILGLRWAYAASQEADPDAFATDMTNARDLISTSMDAMRGLHAQVASNLSRMDTTTDMHNTLMTALRTQIDDIQHADSAEVAAKITFAQAQLQASYSATSKIATLSLVQYLS